jgi:exopolyphosphatase/guanosine-5'-triphosphate,3'-diphosphate pyrophosphatase
MAAVAYHRGRWQRCRNPEVQVWSEGMPDAVPGLNPSLVGAAVDAGSTSVHILVAAVSGREPEPLADESVFLGLADRVDAAGFLGPEVRASLSETLARYAAVARERGADSITFIGTEPLRRAADAARVVHEVGLATGVPLFVLTHEEEAYLTLIGVTSGRPLAGPLAVVDIGGGSTEIITARPGGPVEARGLRIGAGRLAAETLHDDPPDRAEIAALRAAARRWIESIPELAHPLLVAVGGTASNLLKVLPSIPPNRTLTRERLDEAITALAVAPAGEVAARHGINAARARILPAGAALLEAILDRAAADEIRVSEAGLREGAILVRAYAGSAWRDRLSELALGWDGHEG